MTLDTQAKERATFGLLFGGLSLFLKLNDAMCQVFQSWNMWREELCLYQQSKNSKWIQLSIMHECKCNSNSIYKCLDDNDMHLPFEINPTCCFTNFQRDSIYPIFLTWSAFCFLGWVQLPRENDVYT